MPDTLPYDRRRPMTVSGNDEEIVRVTMQEFSQMQLWRNTFADQWEEIAQLVWPEYSNTFFYGNFNWPGTKKTQRQVDATAMMANHRFGAICDSLLTPRNMVWHMLGSDDPDLMRDRDAKLWYEDVTRRLFRARYAPIGNFASQNQQNYLSLGAFGNGAMFVDQAEDEAGNRLRGLRYRAIPLGQLFLKENHQGLINGFIRWFRLTAEQAASKWGLEALPEPLRNAYDAKSQQPYDFLHRVCVRSDYAPDEIGVRGKLFGSHYISIAGECVMEEGGYNSFPIAASRYVQGPGEVYGRGPAGLVLPAIKTLNAEKTTFLKQGHRAADPVLLTADDGLMDFSLRPGALNKGGMSSDGKRLVDVLPTGNIQVTEEMMNEEKSLINDAFLVTLFQILTESPQMSATEVIERTNEKGILLAPTVGRQQSEYLGPLIHRELDLMAEMQMLPPMPDSIREAGGAYDVTYTSPLARAARAQEVSGAMRSMEFALTVVNATQDPSPLDAFDFDTMIPDVASIMAVPESWMADPKAVAAKRQARQEQQQAQQQIQAAPAAAAMMKAQAVAAKAGVGGGGQGGQPA